MVYVYLNIAVALFLGFFTHLIDKKIKTDNSGFGSLSIAMLLTTVESIIFVLIIAFKDFWFDALTTQAMKILFSIDGIFFTMLSFSMIEVASSKKNNLVRLIKYALYLFAIVIVYAEFTTIDVSLENGVIIGSEFLFSNPARKFFPWTWVTLFTALYRYILPVVCFLFLTIIQEDKATQLQKYQSALIGEGFLLMWAISFSIKFISSINPAFSLLFLYAYLFLYVIIYMALTKTTVPSGKAMFVSFIKTILSYLLPAAGVGFLCTFFQPLDGDFTKFFIISFCIYAAIGVLLALKISDLLSTSTRLYTADYEAALEKDLASVDYKGAEMDAIIARMFEILKKNVESSSMGVYILSGTNELSTAYTSNNVDVKIQLNTTMFDTLLNIGKSIVVYSEIEKEHDLAVIKDDLENFFKYTKSDCLFILNEGHNIFGIITLGRKASGDHYKEYDLNVFVKLYSYFFVFGYYMRNISNKDVIGIVNREIRMASQIITSIQENLDHVKNPKIDVGYLMVPSHSIGGEFIDMIRLTATRHLFVVGDLSGKGIAASMNMVILKSIIRANLSEVHDFKQLVVKLNTFVRDSLPKGTIFAGLFALIDFETDTMYYINCGIPALMVYTQVYNNVIEIQGSGHVLGFVKDISPYISVKTSKLQHGDVILACTDGLVQSHSLRGEQFGKERIQQSILDNSTYPAQRMAQFIFDGLVKFMSKEMEDDVSILVLKYEGIVEKEEESPEQDANAQPSEQAAEENAGEEKAAGEDNLLDEAQAAAMIAAAAAEAEAAEAAAAEIADETSGMVNEEAPAAEENPVEETSVEESAVEEPSVEEAPVEEAAAEKESAPVFDDPDLPEGFEMPDLSDLDAMMKEAGL
ncbi:MAG: serine/threonine-protein phosphatase [Treponema sp.]|nr:serine/threonine-protein phosphatase [Treponema sp.]